MSDIYKEMTIHSYLDNIHRFCDLLYLKVFRIVTLGKNGAYRKL